MGRIADAVAALEDNAAASAEESRTLRGITERADSEIGLRLEELESVGTEILNLHGDLDNQIAEYDYAAVQQSVETLQGLVYLEALLPVIDSVVLLTAIRDDVPVPDLTLPDLHAASGDSEDQAHPRLTQDDLDQRFKSDIDRAELQWTEIWGDHEWGDAAERDDHLVQHRAEAEQEAVRDRTRLAGAHLEDLFEYIGEKLWPDLVESVEAGNRDRALTVLTAACAAARASGPGYQLYETNLAQQYETNPASLGAMGEFLDGVQTWLFSQKDG